jgi:uncharacterized membrane protein YkvA (DUF1232 family)
MMTEKTTNMKVKEMGFWNELWQQVRLVYYLLRDPDVPIYLKLLPFLAFGYLLFPIDLVTDLIPVVGQLDDLTVLLIGAKVFIELAPQHVVARHLEMLRQQDGHEPTIIENPESKKDEG